MPAAPFHRAVIAGVGLMGGSLGLVMLRRRLAARVVGLARRRATLRQALRLGAIDEGTLSPEQAARGADLVILAGPVSSSLPLLRAMRPHLAPDCLVTDVGSTKTRLLAAVASLARRTASGPRMFFVGSHPMAGSEKTGVQSAQVDLYAGCHCLVVPLPGTPARVVHRLTAFWKAAGCGRVSRVNAREHDRWTALVSHLPYAAAAGLVRVFAGAERSDPRIAEIAATGFRDTTRVAAGSVDMWIDILISNREEVGRGLRDYRLFLERLETLVRRGAAAPLRRELERVREVRQRLGKRRGW